MRKNLKEARQKAGMTQKQVAEYLGITVRSYQRIESGELLGSISNWDALEDLFKIHQRKLRMQAKCHPMQAGKKDSCAIHQK